MIPFADPEAATRTRERLEQFVGFDLANALDSALVGNAAPDLALTNLERWVRATSSPRLHLEQFAGYPSLARLLMALLGASQPIADSLIQNPELASLVLEPGTRFQPPSIESILDEGRALLKNATSQSHSLDRLRFLKQSHTIPIVLSDLSGIWSQETVWRVLSDLAEALIQLALEAIWPPIAAAKELPPECPVSIIAFGKLGGRELNYSSDVDLVYILRDGTDEKTERECSRFCEALGRALSDRMGRGFIYRVDLRLRPYGAAGPILRSMSSTEVYYKLYAEPWEVQALLRSRQVAGADIADRWEAMIREIAFRPKLSDISLEEMVKMRRRIEEESSVDDLKRGAGGIRDVEFLTQIIQLANGNGRPELQEKQTCNALRALSENSLLEPAIARVLIDGYTFLRKLEHRTQLVGDQQTHEIPASPIAREGLAKLMDFAKWSELEAALKLHRQSIHSLYISILGLDEPKENDRERVAQEMGSLSSVLLQWFDVLPQSDAFYESLLVNQDSLGRVKTILNLAPRLVADFKSSVPLTELLLSGEIEEPTDPVARMKRIPQGAPLRSVAETFVSTRASLCARWVLSTDFDLSEALTELTEQLLLRCLDMLEADWHVIALGSFANYEVAVQSDIDLLLLTTGNHRLAESKAQDLLAMFRELSRHGASIEVDLRLRPEGGKGLLVRTVEGFTAYSKEDMELWERFALGHARLIRGDQEVLSFVQDASYQPPLTNSQIAELLEMKQRIETERVQPHLAHRDVKLGIGGLNDIEWLVHLSEMRHPVGTNAGKNHSMTDRIMQLREASLLTGEETLMLSSAHQYLLQVRNRIALLDFPASLLPENTEKLGRLALGFGIQSVQEFLEKHEATISEVRTLYKDVMGRISI